MECVRAFQIELEFGGVGFRRGENRSTQRKTSRNKGENQQQTQPTYGAHAGVRTRATLVGGESSQRCAIPCSPRVNDPCNSTAVINEQGLYS